MVNKSFTVDYSTANRRKNATPLTREKTEKFIQLNIWHPILTQPETKPHLQIKSVPLEERVNPKENRYILVIQPLGFRACGGQFRAEEAYSIAQATKHWDWSLDAFKRPRCLPELEALINRICKQTAVEGDAV